MPEDSTRINKYLASCGVGSRRACDALIQAGRVEINGQPCMNPGTQVLESDHVKVDGKKIQPKRGTTILLNKPRGLVCTKADEFERNTIYDLLPRSLHHLHHVGRLDRESEGLLIMTNDGDLSQKLMHPTNRVEKEYYVTSNQPYENDHLQTFLSGVYTKEGKLKAKAVKRLSARRLQIVLDHGAKRQIRVMFEALGYQVTKLVRVRIGSLWGGDLEVGAYQLLGEEEITAALTNPAVSKNKIHTSEAVEKKIALERKKKKLALKSQTPKPDRKPSRSKNTRELAKKQFPTKKTKSTRGTRRL